MQMSNSGGMLCSLLQYSIDKQNQDKLTNALAKFNYHLNDTLNNHLNSVHNC